MLSNYSRQDKHLSSQTPIIAGNIVNYPKKRTYSSYHSYSPFPIRYTPKQTSEPERAESMILSSRETSIEQIRCKLKQYLKKTQQNSLLNYQNDMLPEFSKKGMSDHFRTTMFRNNLKKKINLRIIENNSLTSRQKMQSPQFNVSQACLNKTYKISQISEKVFRPKRQYFIHNHQKRKEKIPIPKLFDPKAIPYNLENRQSSYRQRQKGGCGLQPWRRWGKDSEEEQISPIDLL